MAIFSVNNGIIPLINQSVSISSLWCTAINRGTGAGGTSATFKLPEYLFDANRSGLTDALVVVAVNGGGPDFIGYLDVDNATLAQGDDSVTMTANTITAYLNKVWVGQDTHQTVVSYPLTNPVTGTATTWTPARVLSNLFAALPTFYRARVAIGDSSCINTSGKNTLPELVFRNCTYAQALDQVLALFGDVSFTERFSGVKTYLDFYRIQGFSSGSVSVTVADWRDPITAGANVGSLTHSQTVADVTTRVIVYGSPRRFVVSSHTANIDADLRLVKGWDTATLLPSGLTYEQEVVLDPQAAKSGAPGYVSGFEFVYRRWYLPAAFRAFAKLKDLCIARDDGSTYPIQIWKYPTVLTVDGNDDLIGTVSTTPTLLKNAKVQLDENYFELGTAEDGLNVMSSTIDPATDQQLFVWAPATIGITFCFEHAESLYYDTGQDIASDVGFDFKADGLTETIERDDLQYVQFTNAGWPIAGLSGIADITFGSVLYNEDTGLWSDLAANAPVISINDTAVLRGVAQEILKAKCRRHHEYNVTIPYFARAYVVGKQLVIAGTSDPIVRPLMITGVSFDLEANSTSITADNVKPPVRQEAGTSTQRPMRAEADIGADYATGDAGGDDGSEPDAGDVGSETNALDEIDYGQGGGADF